ncbi:MAG TPA: glycosyltransferase family 4 protein [Candidatus Nanoarchaeia archaeon]|uniref:Group 1 glycosyl transferase n=1 Tax=uncultured archaeon Rifle_16ft_4_minimus_37913 TaxID=1665152 RepID=A0A0H4TA00_9ARCH|nr:group 1 glycosyl transferase [uncultured archaeon Rifle_16ft_4_minimus_37913]HKZ33973.1 glycosyltransferase family 4 protein [Candidatus Nanoarchaeia archaeon]
MNILIEGGDLNPPFAEGTRNIALMHALELKRRGHNVVVLTKEKDIILKKKHPKYEEIYGIKFYRWGKYFDLFFTYRKIVKIEKIDLVHIFVKGIRPSAYINFIKMGGGKRIPVIFSLLGWPGGNYKPLNEADKVIITSKSLYKVISLKNSVHIPYGLDLGRFSFSRKKNKDILCLRFPPVPLLRAFRKLELKIPGVKLILNKKNIDNRPETRIILKDLGIKNAIELGHVNRMEDLLKKSKIILDLHYGKDLHLSQFLRCASPPLIILESMACGVIVISNNIPEIREIIDDNKTGILLKTEDEAEIYKILLKAIKNKRIQTIARKEVVNKFDIRKVVIKYEEEYRKLCESL